TDLDDIPMLAYVPDINTDDIVGEGFMKHLVAPNRGLNLLQRKQLDFHSVMATGKYLTDKDSGVNIVTNENGQFIKKSRGTKFEQMDIKGIPSSFSRQISDLERYMEDIGSVHEALLGRAPAGVSAAIAFEQLVANNMNSLQDPIDNLQILLAELGKQFLRLGKKHFNSLQYVDMGQGEAIRMASDKVFSNNEAVAT